MQVGFGIPLVSCASSFPGDLRETVVVSLAHRAV